MQVTIPQKRLFIEYLKIMIPFVIIIILGANYLFNVEFNNFLNEIKISSNAKIDLLYETSYGQISPVLSDLITLSEKNALLNFADTNDENYLSSLEEDFLSVSKRRNVYDQIRFIGIDGMEIIRINYNNSDPYIVSESELQNKSDRYYFTQTINLEQGDVYISNLDLNIENDEIEIPFKPTIRLGTPVYDSNNSLSGVLILNYLAQNWLNSLKSQTEDYIGNFYMINQEGFFLSAPSDSFEWGFMFENMGHKTFQNYFSDDYQTIKNNDYGFFFGDDYYYVFQTIHISPDYAEIVMGEANRTILHDEIKLILQSPIESLYVIRLETYYKYFIGSTIIILFSSIVFFLLTRLRLVNTIYNESLKEVNKKIERKAKDLQDQKLATLNILEDVDETRKELNTAYNSLKKETRKRKELEEMRRNFISLMTHDLKQPLQPIIGYAGIVKEGIKGKNKSYLDNIEKSATEMVEMINNILNFYKLESNEVVLNKTEEDLSDITKNALILKQPLIKLKKIKIISDLKESKLVCDKDKIKEVIINLLDNAIKFSKEKSKIELKTYKKSKKAYFMIKDSGVGIRKEDINKLFEKFYQTKEGKEKGGTGIGLVMARKIIELHKGKIEVKSVYKKGSTFIIILPE